LSKVSGVTSIVSDIGSQRYNQPKWRKRPKPVPGAVEKVVYHKDLFRLEREEKLKQEAHKEEEIELREGFSPENIARMIVEQNRDQQQILREADTSDMVRFSSL